MLHLSSKPDASSSSRVLDTSYYYNWVLQVSKFRRSTLNVCLPGKNINPNRKRRSTVTQTFVLHNVPAIVYVRNASGLQADYESGVDWFTDFQLYQRPSFNNIGMLQPRLHLYLDSPILVDGQVTLE